MGPLALYGLGAGAQLVGKIIALRSARAQAAQLQQQQLGALRPYESAAMAYGMAPTQAEGYQMGSSLNRSMRMLAANGMGDSSAVGPEGLAAVAPIMEQHDQNNLNNLQSIAAQKAAIYQGTSMPGYGTAFGGTLEDVGGLLAQYGGQQEANTQLFALIDKLRQNPGAAGPNITGPAPGDPNFVGPPAPPDAQVGMNLSDPQALMDFILGFREGAMNLGFAF